MRRSKLFFGAAVAAIACASGAAHAARVGVFIGAPFPYYYPVAPVPYYYGPPAVVVAPPPAPAPDYVEQGQPQPGDQGQAGPGGPGDNGDTWYYCDATKQYYPYTKQCSSNWRAVPAQPAPPSN